MTKHISKKQTNNKAVKQKSKQKQERLEAEPIDGGWGWMIVLGASIITMLCSSQGPCFGNLFKQQMDSEGAPQYLPALIFNFQAIMWNMLGSWAGILGRRFGIRKVATIGAIISSSSILLSATVTNPFLFLLSFALLSGAGGGLAGTLSLYIIPSYFNKRLGFANGIASTFGTFGRIFIPQLAVYLQEEYSFFGATLITGGIVMQTIWCSLLYHPPSWHHPKRKEIAKSTENKKLSNIQGSESYTREPASSFYLSSEKKFSERIRSYSENVNIKEADKLVIPSHLKSRHSSVTKLSQISLTGSDFITSYISLNQPEEPHAKQEEHSDPPSKGVWSEYLSVYKDMKIIKNPQAMGLAVITCLVIITGFNFVGLLPFTLSEAGYNEWEIATAMSVQSFSDLAIKMILSCTLDRCCIHSKYIYFSGQIILLITPPLMLLFDSNWNLVITFVCLHGIGLGIIHLLDFYIITKTIEAELLQSVFGISNLLRSGFFAVIGICLGVLPQLTGSYMPNIFFITVIQMLVVILSLVVSYIIYRQSRLQIPDSKNLGQVHHAQR